MLFFNIKPQSVELRHINNMPGQLLTLALEEYDTIGCWVPNLSIWFYIVIL